MHGSPLCVRTFSPLGGRDARAPKGGPTGVDLGPTIKTNSAARNPRMRRLRGGGASSAAARGRDEVLLLAPLGQLPRLVPGLGATPPIHPVFATGIRFPPRSGQGVMFLCGKDAGGQQGQTITSDGGTLGTIVHNKKKDNEGSTEATVRGVPTNPPILDAFYAHGQTITPLIFTSVQARSIHDRTHPLGDPRAG